VTTNLRAHIVLDASGSMAYKGQNEPLSKFRYAEFVATCLSYMILHQTDSVGLITFDTQMREFIPARSASPHLFTTTGVLDNTQPRPEGAPGALAKCLHEVAERLGHRQLVILLSDLFEDAEKLIEAFHHFRHDRHEVIVLQIMSDDELTFPFRKFSLFEDLEKTGTAPQKLKLDPVTVRNNYLENLARHLQAVRDGCNALRISYALINTKDSVEKSLTAYLAQRMGSR
jgi:uncharacterized protein (DUF58 family)